MKILYIITQGEQGGGQKNVFDLACGMMHKGYEIYVAVGDIENEGDKWLHEELTKKGFDSEKLIEIKSLQREVKILRDIKAVWDTIKLIRKIRPDVIHLHSSKAGVVGGFASFLTRSKSVYTVHGFVFLEPINFIKRIIFTLIEFISSLWRKHTILITGLDIKAGRKLFILRNKNKYSLIYNGIKDQRGEMLDRDSARKFFSEKINKEISDDTKIVGTISNLYKTKGLEYLIDAAWKLDRSILFLVLGFGDEKYKSELQEKIIKNGLENNFFLLGKTPSAFRFLKGFDVFTLTSVKEGLPYTLLEAKMAGIPIVATSVGGIPEIAKNIPINLAEKKNYKDIATKITESLKNEIPIDDTLPKIYSLENMIDKTEEVYRHLRS